MNTLICLCSLRSNLWSDSEGSNRVISGQTPHVGTLAPKNWTRIVPILYFEPDPVAPLLPVLGYSFRGATSQIWPGAAVISNVSCITARLCNGHPQTDALMNMTFQNIVNFNSGRDDMRPSRFYLTQLYSLIGFKNLTSQNCRLNLSNSTDKQ